MLGGAGRCLRQSLSGVGAVGGALHLEAAHRTVDGEQVAVGHVRQVGACVLPGLVDVRRAEGARQVFPCLLARASCHGREAPQHARTGAACHLYVGMSWVVVPKDEPAGARACARLHVLVLHALEEGHLDLSTSALAKQAAKLVFNNNMA